MICQLDNFKKEGAALVLFLSIFLAVLAPATAPATALAAQSVIVGWQASTNTGVVGYNIYYGTQSRDYTNKLSVGALTATNISGLVAGATYYFAATSYGALNQESPYSSEISYAVPADGVSPLPLIALPAMTNMATVGHSLVVGMKATGLGSLTYSLGSGAPAGAWINPTNGLFVWNPQAAQAGTSNVISVIVTQNGDPTLTATQSFSLVVQDYISLSPGSNLVAAGSLGGLPLTVYASTPLTNLQFTLNYPPGQLTNLFFSSTNPLVGPASVTPTGPCQALVSIGAAAGQSLAGSQVLGTIGFNAAAGVHTKFVYVTAGAPVALKPDGTTANYTQAGRGRVTIVGPDAMLEPQLAGGTRNLIVYGPLGVSYQVESCNDLGNSGAWSAATTPFTMTNLSQTFQFTPDTNLAAFYRTRQMP